MLLAAVRHLRRVQAKLGDFGSVAQIQMDTGVSTNAEYWGTPPYMPPEARAFLCRV